MAINRLCDGDAVCAIHVSNDEWGDGLKFFSADEDFVQVGTWGYDAGKELAAHFHNPLPREAGWTQEVLYIKQGAIRATVFGLSQQELGTVTAGAGDILVLLRGGHGYEILDDQTQVLEIKNGPYFGADRDRTRF